MARPTVAVLERHLYLYRRLWRGSVFSFFLLPTLFLLSIGLGVGGYVGDVEGVDYVSWVAPGLLASTAFQIGVSESTYGILADFTWVGGLHTMRGTRVSIRDMVNGWLLYVLFVLHLAVLVFLGVMAAFGAVHSPWVLLALPVSALVALAGAAPTTAFSATVRNDGYFQFLFRVVVIPATLFSGVFFPVERMPGVLRPLAYLSPLWHGVELNRAAALGGAPAWPVAAHVGCLAAWIVAGWVWAQVAFRRRLSN
jgi:lipooligosaccharide transport system permease protein